MLLLLHLIPDSLKYDKVFYISLHILLLLPWRQCKLLVIELRTIGRLDDV